MCSFLLYSQVTRLHIYSSSYSFLLWFNHRILRIVPCATLFLKFYFVGVGCSAASVSAVYTDMLFFIVCFRNPR